MRPCEIWWGHVVEDYHLSKNPICRQYFCTGKIWEVGMLFARWSYAISVCKISCQGSRRRSFSDTLQSLDLAPPTRKLMRMKEAGTVEKLFQLPGCSFLKAKPLVKVLFQKFLSKTTWIQIYQSHLIMRARVDRDAPSAREIHQDLELSEHIEDDFIAPAPHVIL